MNYAQHIFIYIKIYYQFLIAQQVLYYKLNQYYEYALNQFKAQIAVSEFNELKGPDEQYLLGWLMKYEDLGRSLTLFLLTGPDPKNLKENKFIAVNNYKISTTDFLHLADFKILFDQHYWSMLDKYKINLENEKGYTRSESEMEESQYSLSYHLNKRGLL